MYILFSIILFCWVISLLRLLISSISSDVLIFRQARHNYHQRKKTQRRDHLPTISILIPAYNEEHTILRSVKSVLASDYPAAKVEIIIVNDGSTDNTKGVLESFKKTATRNI